MTQYQIGIIVGSLRRDSLNRQLARAILKLAPSEFFSNFLKLAICPSITKMTTQIKQNQLNN